MLLFRPGILLPTLGVRTVANQFRACIQRLVIIPFTWQARILTVITAIIAPAGRGTPAFRVRAFSLFLNHLMPLSVVSDPHIDVQVAFPC
jgi:hypothetical protein